MFVNYDVYSFFISLDTMATSVLQPEDCRREHDLRLKDSPRMTDDERVSIIEGKEKETGELPPELREKARVELREEPAIREHALSQMRHFIEKHPAIKKCRTGKSFTSETNAIILIYDKLLIYYPNVTILIHNKLVVYFPH